MSHPPKGREWLEQTCKCGHKGDAHDAGECWAEIDGKQCRCSWWEPTCDAELYAASDDDISLGVCGSVATHSVNCTDGRWHPRCGPHLPAVIAAQAWRVRPL